MPEGHQRLLLAIFGPLTGWAFIGAGIYAWLRRPENRVGALMTALGFAACLAALRVATEPAVFIAGLLAIALQYAVLYHLLVAFPTGTLQTGFERVVVGIGYFSALVVHPVQVLFQDTAAQGLPENPLLVASERDVVAALSDFASGSVSLCWYLSRSSSRDAGAPRATPSDVRWRRC